MDSFKDLLDTFSSRVRSPIVGPFIIAFIALNWKVLYVIVFQDLGYSEKFSYFDSNSSIATLFALPLIISLAASIILVWIKFILLWVIRTPISKVRKLELLTSHQSLTLRQELENDRKLLLAKRENTLIEQAKRDQQIEYEIRNNEIREELQKEILELRKSFEEKNSTKNSTQIAKLEEKLLELENKSSKNDYTELSSEKEEKIQLIRSRIERYRKRLNNDMLSEGAKLEIEEDIIKQLDKIEDIRNNNSNFPSQDFDLDDEIPF